MNCPTCNKPERHAQYERGRWHRYNSSCRHYGCIPCPDPFHTGPDNAPIPDPDPHSEILLGQLRRFRAQKHKAELDFAEMERLYNEQQHKFWMDCRAAGYDGPRGAEDCLHRFRTDPQDPNICAICRIAELLT